eukprot:scaffold45531_cov63-Phaeocystis_antarctica.AAC.5
MMKVAHSPPSPRSKRPPPPSPPETTHSSGACTKGGSSSYSRRRSRARPRTREEAQLVVAQVGNVEIVHFVVVHRVAAVDLTLLEVAVDVVESNGYLEPIAARKRLVFEIDFATRTRAGHLALKVPSDAGVSLAAAPGCSIDDRIECSGDGAVGVLGVRLAAVVSARVVRLG